MRLINAESADLAALLLFTILGVPATGNATRQVNEESPSDLIRFLSRPTLVDMMGVGGCGAVNMYRAAARSLAKLGLSAIPDVEGAVNSIEKHGEQSEFAFNADLLIIAYTQIQGSAAYPRLRRMIGDPKLAFLRLELDRAVALSLTLTSYVSDSQVLERRIRCNRGPEPRDGLDQLILAWEKDDRPWFEASLGPRAKAALNSLLKGRTWADMRASLWHGNSGDGVAVGYRFDIPGRWSEPEETLEQESGYGAGPLISVSPDFDLETLFKDRSGADCGRHRVRFLKSPVGGGGRVMSYLVDEADVGGLLRLIGSCAGQTGKSP